MDDKVLDPEPGRATFSLELFYDDDNVAGLKAADIEKIHKSQRATWRGRSRGIQRAVEQVT
jgi:hypothetical protein